VVAYTYNPSSGEKDEEGELRIQGKPGLHSKTLKRKREKKIKKKNLTLILKRK
jgi:hypothetical protein